MADQSWIYGKKNITDVHVSDTLKIQRVKYENTSPTGEVYPHDYMRISVPREIYNKQYRQKTAIWVTFDLTPVEFAEMTENV